VPAAPATASDSPSAINEVIPAVPRSASQTIRGTIRVSVRVTVDEHGNVVAASAEDPGPSRYFERLSLQAAKKWMFAPAKTGEERQMQVKFNYTRSGTTAKASPTQ
jgi:TonB family protein